MSLTVKKQGGIVVEYAGRCIVFDPTNNNHGDYPILVSHAHRDHAGALMNPRNKVYATEETYNLVQAFRKNKIATLKPIAIGEHLSFGDFEIRIHNAGHILGSVQFEVNTPEGNLLYTGDLGFEKTFTMDPATPVDCDILVIETTFGSPLFNFPKRRDLGLEMVRWTVMEALPKGFIPGYKTDSLGNAQEIISIFNQMTNLPVITSKSTTIMSDIYQKYGFNLDYIDSKSNEGQRLLQDGRCVLVAPKRSKLGIPKLDMALASGWASIMGNRRRAFPLSDHVDYKGLLSFIRKCRPRRVLTFHGGSITRNFYQDIKRILKIDANPLTTIRENIHGSIVKAESRIRNCSRQILRTIKIPGFIYTEDWLVREMAQCGFNRTETKNSLKFLIQRGIIAEGDGGLKLV